MGPAGHAREDTHTTKAHLSTHRAEVGNNFASCGVACKMATNAILFRRFRKNRTLQERQAPKSPRSLFQIDL
jgi:hypothetical protein